MERLLLALSLFLLFSSSLISAVGIDNPEFLPIVKPSPTSLPTGNVTVNISVNSSVFWDTQDYGPLDMVGDILHNWLSNLAWSVSGHTIDTDLDINGNDIYDIDNVNATNGWFTFINATTGNFTDIYVTNESIYIGDTIKLTASGATGSVLNVSGGNVSSEYYFGSGLYLTDINWTGINFTNAYINATGFNGSEFNGGNFTGDNFFGGNFFGVYDWIAELPWLIFNGTYLSFNESKLQEETEVVLREETINLVSSGGTASATTSVLDFEIKEIRVNTTAGTKFRFEAVETTSGNIIDKDRIQHETLWAIEKNYVINDSVNLTITSANPDDTFTATIKYLDNWD